MKTPKRLYLCAIISGLLTCAAFTFAPLAWLCFFSLIPMLVALFFYQDRNCGQIKIIFIYTVAYHLPEMLFLYNMYPLTRYGLDKIQSAALLTAAIVAVAVIEGAVFAIAFLPYNRLRKTRLPLPIVFAALYIMGEFLQGVLAEMAFPWCRLGTILCDFTPFIRSASIFGTMFLSLLIVLINALIAYAIVLFLQRGRYNRPVRALLCAALLFCANLTYGLLAPPQSADKTLKVVVVQGNISSITDWDTSVTKTLDIYSELTRDALQNFDADVVLWPEAAIPVYDTSPAMDRVKELAAERGCTIVTGVYTKSDETYHEYNSLTAYYPDKTKSAPYNKQKLVPMGEYIPFYELFEPFLQPDAHLIPGKESTLIPAAGSLAGGVICYESAYPEITRGAARAGAEFFLMSSNDSWFGATPAQRQHLAHARMRCVENGRWMARAGNTGISAAIAPDGQIIDTIPADTAAYLCCEIGVSAQKTPYTLLGDIIVIPCAVVWIFGFFKKRHCV